MPIMFHGIGAFHRLLAYEVEKYGDLSYWDYTRSDLAKWHNGFVSFFSGEKPPWK